VQRHAAIPDGGGVVHTGIVLYKEAKNEYQFEKH